MSNYHLIVHNPFGNYSKGSLISDPAEVQAVMSGPNAAHVHRILPLPTEPAIEPNKTEAKG